MKIDPKKGYEQPEVDPPGGIVEVLSRWEDSGGQWRILKMSDQWVTAGLFSCAGDEMSRVTSERTTTLAHYLAGRTSSHD